MSNFRRQSTRSSVVSRHALLVFAIVFMGAANQVQAQWSSNGTNIYYNSGTVGIGTSTPATHLDVNGDIRGTRGTFGAAGLSPNYELQVASLTGADRNIFMAGVSGFSNGFKVDYVNALQAMKYTFVDGNVGIGATSPQYRLSLGGSSDKLGFYSDSTHYNSIEFYNSGTGRMVFDQNTAAGGGYTWQFAGAPLVTLQSGGNVGIGTTSPSQPLTVAGNAQINGTIFQSVGTGINAGIDTTTNGKRWQLGSNVGPGSGDGTFGLYSYTAGVRLWQADGATGNLSLQPTSGNVGIGKTNPTVALDVVGSINLTGTVNAKYQDVAEWVPSSENLSSGTVVVLDATKSNQVTSSIVSYDTRVAGVVSEQPGIALGEKTDDKVLVATTGRVRVKVDASKGAIHIGDLLVTSDVPGVAMKSEPVEFAGRKMHMPGTLIGKALEPLEKGTGTILVLLSLQ